MVSRIGREPVLIAALAQDNSAAFPGGIVEPRLAVVAPSAQRLELAVPKGVAVAFVVLHMIGHARRLNVPLRQANPAKRLLLELPFGAAAPSLCAVPAQPWTRSILGQNRCALGDKARRAAGHQTNIIWYEGCRSALAPLAPTAWINATIPSIRPVAFFLSA
jgi:hypothetical protein